MTDPPISEFMNRNVLFGPPSTPIQDVIEQMLEQRDGAFVVCEDRIPIGVVTERDTLEVLHDVFSGHGCKQMSAQSIMASPIHTLPDSASMSEVIAIMKGRFFRRVPIVDERNQIAGIVNLVELQRAMNEVLERRSIDLEKAVEERTADLQRANHQLEELAVRDGLTGLLNRRAMTLQLEKLSAVTMRYGNPYSVILCDVDHFKGLNDTLGHLEGDRVLREVSAVLEESVRASDLVYRYGGEEFLIALPETKEDGAIRVADRMRRAMEDAQIPHPESSASEWVTLSFGVSQVGSSTETVPETIERADRALYKAKEDGRNRVVGATEIDSAAKDSP